MTKVRLTCYSLKELAGIYNISIQTLKKRLTKNNLNRPATGNIFSVNEMEQVFNVLGWPEEKK